MTTLAGIISQLYDNDTAASMKENLLELEKELRSDNESRLAQTLVQMLDNDEVQTEEDLIELQGMIDEYKAEKLGVPSSFEYNFEPPQDLLEELGVVKKTERMTITKEGQKYEIREEGAELVEVGPVDDFGNPVEGHPEYAPAIPTFSESVQEAKTYDSDLKEIVGVFDEPSVLTKSKLVIHRVTAHIPGVGGVVYKPIDIVPGVLCVSLIFDPEVNEPTFIPEVGFKFQLEYQNMLRDVMYAGVKFSYSGLEFLCLSLIQER